MLCSTNAGHNNIGLPDPSTALVGDTYILLNIGSASITIDRTGFPGVVGAHGQNQLINGAATNGTLPGHEAVTIIYTGVSGVGGNEWYGIGL